MWTRTGLDMSEMPCGVTEVVSPEEEAQVSLLFQQGDEGGRIWLL